MKLNVAGRKFGREKKIGAISDKLRHGGSPPRSFSSPHIHKHPYISTWGSSGGRKVELEPPGLLDIDWLELAGERCIASLPNHGQTSVHRLWRCDAGNSSDPGRLKTSFGHYLALLTIETWRLLTTKLRSSASAATMATISFTRQDGKSLR